MSSSTTEVFNKSGVESTMNKIGGTFQEISSDYVNADQQMISNLTTPDGAMFGAGATKVLNAWDENSGTLEDFMTTFENWAALVSGMATQYADLETGTYKVKDGSPYSEDDIAKRARDFHTTALKTKAGITAFNTAQSDYYEKNKDKDYLQSYDNNGIAYTSVRRLENGKIVETKFYEDEQGNLIAEEEHWTWNDKEKKFEHTTEYYSGGSIDDSGQYNHTGSKTITEKEFEEKYNKIKAASEAQTGSGNTGGGGEDTSPLGDAGPDGTDQVIINPFNIPGAENITMTTNYDDNNQPISYTIKDQDGNEFTLTPEEYEAIMTQEGTATVTENGKTVTFEVDKDKKMIIKTTSDDDGDISREIASIDENGKVTVSYKYRDAGTEELVEVTEEQYKNLQKGQDVHGSSDGKDGPLTITTYKIENGTYTETTDNRYKRETKREDSSGRTTYYKTTNKETEESDEFSIDYDDEGNVNCSVDGTITRNGKEHKYSYKNSKEGYSEIEFDGVTVSEEELANLKKGKVENDKFAITTEYSIKQGRYTAETYNSNNKLIMHYHTERDENGDLEREIEVVYKDDGSKETSTETTYESGEVQKTSTYDYERRTQTTTIYENGDLEREIEVVYRDDDLRETYTEIIYENGKVIQITTIKYDENGEELTRETKDGNGNTMKEGE